MQTIQNPILPGFHPDPSIIRVGDDFYIATSTFEWFPGVLIHHSKDLKHWTPIATPLNTLEHLDMRGNPDSCGVWAPCLSYRDGVFYLCFSNVRRFAGDFKDTPNYISTATDIRGPWSQPVFVNSSGFDPSLFIDDDGRAWFLNMRWDHRADGARNNWLPGKYFNGILLQELDLDTLSLKGKARHIFEGSPIGLSEGPHLYKRNGWYYLLLAEGGTGKDHACTFARSRNIQGPYEADPDGPIVTSAAAPSNPIKRSGHGDWVEDQHGNCYLVHLCGRPLPYRGRCVMGRETALQNIHWTQQGWPRLTNATNEPELQVDVPFDGVGTPRATHQHVDFTKDSLPIDFLSLRMPLSKDILSYTDNPGYLRLYGKASLGSLFEQALVARRQQGFRYTAQTELSFYPETFQHMAGLVCYYNSKKYYYVHITCNEQGQRLLDVSMCLGDDYCKYPMNQPISLPAEGRVALKAEVDWDRLTFSYRVEDGEWQTLPMVLDYSVLSDEVGDNGVDANFTGAFVGVCCQDLTGQSVHADFSFFDYQEHSCD